MIFPDLIARKRDGEALTAEEIYSMVTGYTSGQIPDYQMSAMLMAVYFQGMTDPEIAALTRAMIDSGDRIDLSGIPGVKVDKHSTGGVGDKVSLILAPLVAAAGVPVPMMAGRGLGHTGGTLDKLEAIPGFRTQLSDAEFRDVLRQTGFAMIGQTEKIVPADRKLYALRDVTATVPSIPLIVSSILSKKKAEGTDALVLDVKIGRGAFLKSRKETHRLAEALVRLGNALGLRTRALLTRMDQPLGRAVGNWPETREAVQTLRGQGPEDLLEVTLALGSVMLVLGGKAEGYGEAAATLKGLLASGEPFRRFREMTRLQGGDVSFLEEPDRFPGSAQTVDVPAPEAGFVSDIDAFRVGLYAMSLGAGRTRKEDTVDPAAGLVLHKKAGSPVEKGETLATVYTNRREDPEHLGKRLLESFAFSPEPPDDPGPLVEELLDETGRHPFQTKKPLR